MDNNQALWLQGLAEGWSMRLRPLGGSMAPCLRAGDIVHICPGKSCQVGDIILWQQGDGLFLHRVVAKKNACVITKGDSLGSQDKPVKKEQILGRAVTRERHGRIRRLDHLGRRLLGLAWCFLSWIPGLVVFLVKSKRTLKYMGLLPSRGYLIGRGDS